MNDLVNPTASVAWYVEDEEEGADIVFALEKAQAAVAGACKLWSEPEILKVERLPEYDHYAALGYVPAEILYNDGWTFECPHCFCNVSKNNEEEDERWEPLEPKFNRKVAFCSRDCQADFNAKSKRIQEEKDKAQKYLLELFPGISFTRCWGGYELNPLVVEFHFPGGVKAVRWEAKDPKQLDVIKTDLDAWNSFIGTIPGQKSLPCSSVVEVKSEPVT
jgi:hypothetical protein